MAWTGEIVGVVTLDQLERVPVANRTTVRVQDVAMPLAGLALTTPDAALLEAAGAMARSTVKVALVFADRVLVGIVTPSDLNRTTPRPVTV